jgi:hypothetical protein
MTDLESRLRSYVAPDDNDEDRGEIRALMVEAADEIERLNRRCVLVGAMTAEILTLREHLVEALARWLALDERFGLHRDRIAVIRKQHDIK